MRIKKKMIKYGNSCAVIIPKIFLDAMGVDAGDEIELEIKEDHIILRWLNEK